MKILHCAETIKGGVASYLNDVLPYQRSLFGDENVSILVPFSQKELIHFESGVFGFFDFGSRISSSFSLLLKFLLLVWRYDIIHLHSTYAGVFLRIPAFLLRKKVIYCAHGWSFDRDASGYLKNIWSYLELVLVAFSDCVLCISQNDYDLAIRLGVPSKKLRLVKNATPDFLSLAESSNDPWFSQGTRVLFVGRFDRQKGFDIFCDEISNLSSDFECVAIGGSVLGDEFAINTPANLRIVGWLDRSLIAGYYKYADVLVVPSRWEGFGLVALEAMSAECAIITSGKGGLGELVIDGLNGWHADIACVGSVSNILLRESVGEMKIRGKASRVIYLRDYSITNLNKAIVDVYSFLLPASSCT